MRLLIMMLLCSLCLLSACAPPLMLRRPHSKPSDPLTPFSSGHFHHDP